MNSGKQGIAIILFLSFIIQQNFQKVHTQNAKNKGYCSALVKKAFPGGGRL
jgi:hypothetical protein